MNAYAKGNLVRVEGRFTDENGDPTDPTVVKCAVLPPGQVVATTYTYGSDASLVKDGAGVYHVDVSLTTSGLWRYRWYATGTGQAADESEFEVKTSPF